ncbi:hypothetical protein NDU88_000855 [Pleurodeles waltl]|uniref:Uncharacterized protein n=1 Tax=Pleurodeles waltl TaxID=8319 RepID=A0AAV7MJA3_PLEWA|nr:hypothetical protein NDU88_000855 [Pleurodeles waltl]
MVVLQRWCRQADQKKERKVGIRIRKPGDPGSRLWWCLLPVCVTRFVRLHCLGFREPGYLGSRRRHSV